MKIGFICSEKYFKYDKLIKEIIDNINNNLQKKGQAVASAQVGLNTRKKYDLYIVVTDDIDDFELICSKIKSKSKPILITQNLDEKYIRTVITLVADIIYIKSSIEIISNRLVNIIKKSYEQKTK